LELSDRGLDASLESTLSAALTQFRDTLDAATLPSQVAAFPERARTLVRSLGQRIAEEVAKKQRDQEKKSGKGDGKTAPQPPVRNVRVLRASEVSAVTRVSSVPEWEQLMSKLDQRVRQLLRDFDVELG